MKYRMVIGILLTLLSIGTLTLVSNIQPAKAWTGGTIRIRADGSVDPSTAPISSVDNITYTLTENIIYDQTAGGAIVVERSNTVIDGAGYTLQGQGNDYLNSFGVQAADYIGTGRNVTFKNLKITEFGQGFDIFKASNLTISGNNITRNFNGISIWISSDITISGNDIDNIGTGICLHSSSNNNTISGNNIIDNLEGIELMGVSGNNITENNIVDNSNYGILLMQPANNNRFYHNNLINNTPKQVFNGSSFANTWDDGYPSGGNYWNDHNPPDIHSGPNQDETGSDGIGDEPYTINAQNRDRYPLMHAWEGVQIVEVATRGGENATIKGNMTITNAIFTKNVLHFSASGSAGATGWVNVTFPMINTTQINVFINKDKLVPPPFPIITTNGTHYFIYLEFTLSTRGITIKYGTSSDINDDGMVDIVDIVIVALAFGSQPGDDNWDPRADIAEAYGLIDIVDIVKVAIDFGKVYP